MQALQLLRIQAHANRLANFRLHTAMAALPQAELDAQRVNFFPTLMATLNHILGVDQYYIGVLYGDEDGADGWAQFAAAGSLHALAERQRASDERLIAWLLAADDAALDRTVRMPRGLGRVQTDQAAHMLQHLFMHQTHHRGQIHAMLCATEVAPPQLDEFLMPSEPQLRTIEMAALGWSETEVYGQRSA